MTTLAINTGVTSYGIQGSDDTAWVPSGGYDITLAPGHGGKNRYYTIGSALDAVHDGCTITDIKIEFVANKGSAWGPITAYADFAGIYLSVTDVSAASTAYSANGGAGTLPSTVRVGEISSTCHSDETLYTMQVNMSLPTITITYIDNGWPHTLFFGSNF